MRWQFQILLLTWGDHSSTPLLSLPLFIYLILFYSNSFFIHCSFNSSDCVGGESLQGVKLFTATSYRWFVSSKEDRRGTLNHFLQGACTLAVDWSDSKEMGTVREAITCSEVWNGLSGWLKKSSPEHVACGSDRENSLKAWAWLGM